MDRPTPAKEAMYCFPYCILFFPAHMIHFLSSQCLLLTQDRFNKLPLKGWTTAVLRSSIERIWKMWRSSGAEKPAWFRYRGAKVPRWIPLLTGSFPDFWEHHAFTTEVCVRCKQKTASCLLSGVISDTFGIHFQQQDLESWALGQMAGGSYQYAVLKGVVT